MSRRQRAFLTTKPNRLTLLLLVAALAFEVASLLLPASSVHYIAGGNRRHFPVQDSPWLDHVWWVLRWGGLAVLVAAFVRHLDSIETIEDIIAQQSRDGVPGADKKDAGRGSAPVNMEEVRH
jgi:hypothetical protein